jgi:hypothetical protein
MTELTYYRISAGTYDEASAKAWAKHPQAKAIEIRYLYMGWWEYTVLMEESA